MTIDLFKVVPGKGVEPLLLAEPDPKSGVSANFTTRANFNTLLCRLIVENAKRKGTKCV